MPRRAILIGIGLAVATCWQPAWAGELQWLQPQPQPERYELRVNGVAIPLEVLTDAAGTRRAIVALDLCAVGPDWIAWPSGEIRPGDAACVPVGLKRGVCRFDVNGSGHVDLPDVAAVLAGLGQVCTDP